MQAAKAGQIEWLLLTCVKGSEFPADAVGIAKKLRSGCIPI